MQSSPIFESENHTEESVAEAILLVIISVEIHWQTAIFLRSNDIFIESEANQIVLCFDIF